MAHKVFIKIDTIPGDSSDIRRRDEIEVLGWNWSVSVQPASAGGRGVAAKPIVSGLTFSHRIDKASPLLMSACFSGKVLKEAVLSIPATTGNFDYYVIRTQDITISSVLQSDQSADESPVETVSLGFGKISEEYTEIRQDGTPGNKIQACFDMKKNKPC